MTTPGDESEADDANAVAAGSKPDIHTAAQLPAATTDRAKKPKDYSITKGRIAAWVLMGGVGLVLVIIGLVGIFAKG